MATLDDIEKMIKRIEKKTRKDKKIIKKYRDKNG